MAGDKLQSPGRDANEALPLGDRDGQVPDEKTRARGRSSVARPGPDDVPAEEIGNTFKKKP